MAKTDITISVDSILRWDDETTFSVYLLPYCCQDHMTYPMMSFYNLPSH